MRKPKSGGGWQAVRYSLKSGSRVGMLRFWRVLRSKNACKTCAFGMGGQTGGMVNESGHFPEVCKKSMQAVVADMQGRIEPKFFETYSIEQLKSLTSRELEACGRLVDPLIAEEGATHYRVMGWSEALDRAATALKNSPPRRSFFYASGRSSNEAGFLMQILARCYGTNHVNNCSYYCHQASGVGLGQTVGTGTATIELSDLEKCDLVFLIGGNPASNHPRMMTTLRNLRKRGGRVIVVNPLKEVGLENFRVPSSFQSILLGTPIASLYLQPTIGGDIALFAGIAKYLIENGAVDSEFVDSATEGFAEFVSLVRSISWEDIVAGSGVPRELIEQAAAMYSMSERAIFAWTMGITHHEHGVENVQWIVNLALLRGMVGKEGAGLLPIRGHSNVQGLGSIGVSPAVKAAVLEKLTGLGIDVPAFAGYDTMSCMEAANRGDIDFGFCLGGNLYGSNPDAAFASRSLGQVNTLVYLSTKLNTGHAHGLGRTTIVLPVLARDEEAQSTTQESMFNFVRLSDGGPSRCPGPRGEVEVIAELGQRALPEAGSLDWGKLRSHEEIRGLIGRLIPGWEHLTDIGTTKREFHIPGRILHQPRFNTPSGKAVFSPHPLPKLAELGARQLRLMTVRSEGQFNTVVYEEEDIYRGQERRDVILINADDMKHLQLTENQAVTVSSEVGEMKGILARSHDIARGCAMMYYPEANVLVPRSVDPQSKTPAFKATIVTITAQ